MTDNKHAAASLPGKAIPFSNARYDAMTGARKDQQYRRNKTAENKRIARCTISHLNGKNGSPVRDSQKGALQRAAGFRSCSGRFWRVAWQRQ